MVFPPRTCQTKGSASINAEAMGKRMQERRDPPESRARESPIRLHRLRHRPRDLPPPPPEPRPSLHKAPIDARAKLAEIEDTARSR